MIRRSTFALLLSGAGLALATPLHHAIAQAAAPAPGAFKPNDRVDADYLGNGKWIPATVLSVENGGYEIEERGFIVLRLDGGYQHLGVGQPGHYRFDAATGVTSFTGGYMDGATATAVDGRRDRMFLVPYAKSERKLRWTCTRVG